MSHPNVLSSELSAYQKLYIVLSKILLYLCCVLCAHRPALVYHFSRSLFGCSLAFPVAILVLLGISLPSFKFPVGGFVVSAFYEALNVCWPIGVYIPYRLCVYIRRLAIRDSFTLFLMVPRCSGTNGLKSNYLSHLRKLEVFITEASVVVIAWTYKPMLAFSQNTCGSSLEQKWIRAPHWYRD